jgi:vacuolar-type H+-ATPase subunit I/STV1
MFHSVFKTTKAYKIYVILGIVVLSVFFHDETLRRTKNDWIKEKNSLESTIAQKEGSLQKVKKKLQTMNQFLEETSVRQVIDENERVLKQMKDLQKELSVLRISENQLRKKLRQMSQVQAKIDLTWKTRLKKINQGQQLQLKELEGQLQKKEKLLSSYQERPLFDLSGKYHVGGKDISDLVIRLRFLKYLCDFVSGSMGGKKSEYNQLISDLKHALPDDAYIRKMNRVKVYTNIPMIASLKEKYSKKEKNNKKVFIEASNNRISDQLRYLLDYIKITYV